MRRALRLMLGSALLLLVLALLAWVASDTSVVHEYARRRLLGALRDTTTADVTIGRVRGRLLHRLELEDLRIAVGGRAVLRVPRAVLTYDPFALLRGRLDLGRLVLFAPRARLVRTADGWQLPLPRSSGAAGWAGPVGVGRLEVRDGRIALALLDETPPRRLALTALTLTAAGALGSQGAALRLASLSAVPRGIDVSPVALDGEARLAADGTIELRGLGVTTARSRLVLNGRLAADRRVDARLEATPLAARELRAVVPGLPLGADLRARLTARGPSAAVAVAGEADLGDAGTLGAEARVDLTAAPPRHATRVVFRRLDPAAALGHAPRVRLDGRARAVGRGLGTLAYRLASELHVPRLEALAPALPGRATATVHLRGQGTDPGTRRAALRLRLRDASVRGLALRGAAEARLAGTRVEITRATLDGPRLRADASGTLDLERRTADLALTGSADATVVGAAAGRIEAQASVRGGLEAADVRGTATGSDVAAGTVRSARTRLAFMVEGLGGHTSRGTGEATLTGLQVSRLPPQDMTVKLDWRRAGGVDRASADVHTARGDELSGVLERTAARLRGELRRAVVPGHAGPPWQLVHPVSFTVRDGITLESATLRSGAQAVTLAGHLALHGDNAATLTASDIELRALCALLDADCAGLLSARVELTGSAASPRLSANGDARRLRLEGIAYGRLTTVARYADRRLELHVAHRHPSAGELTLDGSVPVDLAWAGPGRDLTSAALDLTLRASRLDLTFVRTLAPTTLRRSAGWLSIDLRVTGPRAALRAEGSLTVDEGLVELAATGVRYEHVRARLTAVGTALEVNELHMEAGDGTLAGSGRLALGGDGLPVLDVALRLDRFLAVRHEAYEATLDGTLALRGTLGAPELTGSVEVVRAIIRPAVLPASSGRPERDPTITIVNAPEPEAAEAPPPSPGLLDVLGLAVDVRIARNAWIRRADADVEFGGELRLTKAPHGPVGVAGRLRLRRGWYAFQGRRFEIVEGTIVFAGETPPRPVFDVTAVHRTGTYRIIARVEGPSDRPALTLQSEPPLEQADILAVLVFGRPTHELGRGETVNLQERAIAIGTSYVAPELTSSLMSTLGLDTLGVEPPRSTERGRVTVGRYLAGDVFISLAQEFGSAAATIGSVEYGLTPSISVRGSTSSDGDSAVDVFWHRRY